ncbi:MAG: DsrE family protein [Chloroflexi bacterium]|nr:DsrE family protein [Chloroflexota bacterium]
MPDKKRVAVIIRRSPLNSVLAAEGLRQAVGLTLAENQVNVYLLGEAVWLAVPLAPQVVGGEPIAKHMEALAMLGARVVADEESLEARHLKASDLRPSVERLDRQALAHELAQAEAAYAF